MQLRRTLVTGYLLTRAFAWPYLLSEYSGLADKVADLQERAQEERVACFEENPFCFDLLNPPFPMTEEGRTLSRKAMPFLFGAGGLIIGMTGVGYGARRKEKAYRPGMRFNLRGE